MDTIKQNFYILIYIYNNMKTIKSKKEVEFYMPPYSYYGIKDSNIVEYTKAYIKDPKTTEDQIDILLDTGASGDVSLGYISKKHFGEIINLAVKEKKMILTTAENWKKWLQEVKVKKK